MTQRVALCSVFAALFLLNANTPVASRTERLAKLAELDGAVRYFHPDVVSGAVHWDSLLAARAVAIADAPSVSEYRRRITELVQRLGDPATYVVEKPRSWSASDVDSVLIIRAGASPTRAADVRTMLARASAVVVDVRGSADGPPSDVMAVLFTGSVRASDAQGWRYEGFPPAVGMTSGGYRIAARAIAGESFAGASARPLRVAFLADAQSVLPPVAQAIRNASGGFIVSTSSDPVAVGVPSHRLSMGEDVFVNVRISERAGSARNRVAPDTVVAADPGAMAAAARFARLATPKPLVPSVDTTRTLRPIGAPSYPEWHALLPPAGYRLVAAFRLWNTMHYFFPYKHVMGGDWNAALRAAIPQVEVARDSGEFVRAIAEFAAKLNDTHVGVNSPAFQQSAAGLTPPPIRVRFIENQLVITKLPVDSVRARTGLRVGDIVVDVDGEPIESRFRRLAPYYAASTPQSLRNRLSTVILNGPDRSIAKLTVRDSAGVTRAVELQRTFTLNSVLFAKDRSGTSLFRMLPGNVGYVDLDRMPAALTDSMFTALRDARAIIFDMRGYPMSTAWSVGPRINANPEPTPAAKFRRLVVSSPDTTETTVFQFTQPIPSRGAAPRYTGQTVMLIDERAISQSEHTGLFFLAANGTKFIGSPTTGANGDVTSVLLPGRISVSFSGHDVRFPNDKQLQRRGHTPDMAVHPTIAGIRAGRDEVLETAFRYLGGTGPIPADTGRDLPPPPPVRALPPEPAPEGWNVSGNLQQGIRAGVDINSARTGTSSGHITTTGFGSATITQLIKPTDYVGKRVRFAAYVKAQFGAPASSSAAALWMRVDGDKGVLAFDNMSDRAIRQTTNWARVEIVLDVPDGARGISFGLLFGGPGEAWIDDVTFEVVGPDVPTTGRPVPSSPDPAAMARMIEGYLTRPAQPVNLGFELRR